MTLVGIPSPSRADSGFVTVKGKQFFSPDGQPLLLKGIGLGNWLLPEGYMFNFKSANSPRLIATVLNELVGEDQSRKFWKAYRDNYITLEDIRFIKRSGFNSIRVPFNYRLFVTENDPPSLRGIGYELLDRLIKWCAVEKVYVILDMHAAPGGQTGDNIDDSWGYPFLFENPESQELTVKLWAKLAARYRDEKIVVGYDLLNEPIAHHFDAAQLNPKLEPLYKRITAEIRKVDQNHIIFLGGAQWDTNFSVFGPPFDDKLVYTFHKYWTEPTQKVIQEYIDFGNKHNVPVWLGESGENSDEWINSFRTMLETNAIGWCFWPYKKLDSARGVVSIPKPDGWDVVAAYADHPRSSFADVRQNRPAQETVKTALDEFLKNIAFQRCKVNEGYLKALGLTAP
jgi:aryl-phospho-beta-D-glucosidase BglC (GH1 family)